MKRHPKAKAARTGSIDGNRNRRAFATRGTCRSLDGSGAPANGSGGGGMRSRRGVSLALVSLVVLLALAFASAADAASFQRPFKETFGSAAQPSFGWATEVAVDHATGDVLVGDYVAETLNRFHADGTPAPFAALGGNSIDGKEGPGGKPCAEEPASCDKTPQNKLQFIFEESTEIAIDESGGPTNGDIYLTQPGVVDIFASDGKYLGQLTAAGFDSYDHVCGVAVDPTGAVYVAGNELFKYVPGANPAVNTDITAKFAMPEPPVCTMALGAGPSAGMLFGVSVNGGSAPRMYQIDKETGQVQYKFAEGFGNSQIAVDPSSGRVLARRFGNSKEVGEFEVQDGAEPVRVSRLLTENGTAGFAVNSSGEAILAEGGFGPNLKVYGRPGLVPTLTSDPASNVIGTKATLSGTVNPSGLAVTECVFEYGTTTAYGSTAPCEGAIPPDSVPHAVSAGLSGLEPNGATYHFRLVAKNANGQEESSDRTFVTADTVETNDATAISLATATLNGALRPEGLQLSDCHFEYGISTNAGFEGSVPCSPPAGSIPQDFSQHPVSAGIAGLQAAATYKFRLLVTSTGGPFAGTFLGKVLTFETQGKPAITEVRASAADQSSVTLEAKIAPRGFDTSYRFEWGPTSAYGHSAPAGSEPLIGGGEAPRRVTADIAGLSAASVYHYRVVAHNEQDTTTSPDQTLETLNTCGLPDGRCFELVSPRDAGPVAIPGEASSTELRYQAATAPGSLAYFAETGDPSATKGTTVVYQGTRGSAGWSSSQLSAPITARNETGEGVSQSSRIWGLSGNLSCGVVESTQPLTADASMKLVFEGGGGNLYRRNPDGSYTGITKLAPENLEAGGKFLSEYEVEGFSADCSKVIFRGPYHYPGVPGVGADERLYEWDEGTLRSVGFVPGPSGEAAVEAVAGVGANHANIVSDDGSRVFFSAQRQTSANSEEIGTRGVFVREDGTVTRDVSLSETATPDQGATYRWATPDGSRVFFTANAGLTTESSSEGEDLYEYDLESETLTDLSVEAEEGGAQVAGFIGGSDDGSRVYFVAQGQLLPGRGKTLAENQEDKTYSVYGAIDGEIRYAGAVAKINLLSITNSEQGKLTSRVSPDGRYLLFESRANVTGFESHTVPQAYLYDAEADSEPTVCVSCRQDGGIPAGPNETPSPFSAFGEQPSPLYASRYLVMRNGKPEVFFVSRDKLASGGVEAEGNLYEWTHGQVFHIATEPPGLSGLASENTEEGVTYRGAELYVRFGDASADGADLYFATPQRLNWEDGDERFSVYDARIGGGFPEPPTPTPCNAVSEAVSEGSCQGSSSQAPSMPGAASNSFNGPGNQKAKKHHKKKHHKKKHHKKKHHKKKHHKKKHHKKKHHKKSARHANGNGRAGK